MDRNITRDDLQLMGTALGEVDAKFDKLFGDIGHMAEEIIERDIEELEAAMAALFWEWKNR